MPSVEVFKVKTCRQHVERCYRVHTFEQGLIRHGGRVVSFSVVLIVNTVRRIQAGGGRVKKLHVMCHSYHSTVENF